jgi:Fe-S cluster assembly iron-binding protein IscA
MADSICPREDAHILQSAAPRGLIGTTMDDEVKALSACFTFVNLNEKGCCACGDSFHVRLGIPGE